MARLAPSRETLIALFAKSGNVCAFPGCSHELVTERNVFVGQLCHIEAANAGGQRFNPASTDEERRSFGNLLLLCYRHHKETDDVSRYDAETLREIKILHESLNGEKPFKIDEAFLYHLETEMQSYWEAVSAANDNNHVIPQFAVRVNIGAPATHQFVELRRAVERISELLSWFAQSDSELNQEIRRHLGCLGYDVAAYDALPYYRNPFVNRNWELHSLTANNMITDLLVALKQAEVRFLEEYVKTHGDDRNALASLNEAKNELLKMAVSAAYAD